MGAFRRTSRERRGWARALPVSAVALLALGTLAVPAGAAPAVPRTTDATTPASSQFGDVTGDGWSDLYARYSGAGSSAGGIFLYPGHGSWLGGSNAMGWGYDNYDAITRHGDINGDGVEDIFVRNPVNGYLYLKPGTVPSSLGMPFDSGIDDGAGWNTVREITAVGDFNRDGNGDVVAVQISTGYLYLYTGNGSAYPGTFTSKRYLGAGWNTVDELVGVGDFNRDGYVDLVARQKSTGYLYLYTGNGSTFTSRRYLGAGWGGYRDITCVGDFDRDGYIDVLAIEKQTGYLYLYTGNGAGFSNKRYLGSGWGVMEPLF